MISLHTLLAAANGSESTGGILDLVIAVGIVLAVLLVVIAFFVGFKKGIRRMGWKGLTWLLSGGLFLLLRGVVLKDADDIITIVLAVGSVVVTMILYNVASVVFRPKMKWKRLKNFELRNKADDLEYEADYSEYDSMVARDYVAINQGMKPGFLERVFGGVTAIINLFVFIVAVALAAVTFINMSQVDLGLGDLNKFLGIGTDFVLIGFMTVLGCVGFDRGFFCGLRWIFVTFGSLIALGGAMAVAFLFTGEGKPLYDIYNTVNGFFAGTLLDMNGLVAKVVLGGVLFIPMLIVIALLNYILGMAARGIRSTKPTRLVDGLIGTIILIAIAVVLSLLVIGVCYVLQEKGIFFTKVTDYLGGSTKLGNAYHNVWKDMVYDAFLANLLA
jgi:hypothetical protein